MHAKMLNILGMRQILQRRIRPMELFEMVNLVLPLVVAVMSRPETEVREGDAGGCADNVFGEGDGAAFVFVEEV